VSKRQSGYRVYDKDAVRRIRFIKQAQQCGFTLSEIRQLLTLRVQASACCGDVRKLAVEKKQQLEGKIRTMRAMSKALDRLISECAGDAHPIDDCSILSALDRGVGSQ
jgi:MerR family Zn(II)-responsive transcriptional regulator of zntA